MRASFITAVADMLNELPIDGLTGEETQFLLKQLGMEEQMLRQLIMSFDYNKVKLLVREKTVLMDAIILENYKFDRILSMLGYGTEESSFPPQVESNLAHFGYNSESFKQTVMAHARINKNFQHLFTSI